MKVTKHGISLGEGNELSFDQIDELFRLTETEEFYQARDRSRLVEQYRQFSDYIQELIEAGVERAICHFDADSDTKIHATVWVDSDLAGELFPGHVGQKAATPPLGWRVPVGVEDCTYYLRVHVI